MAVVFQAVADESDGSVQTGPFVYGGFVAPVTEWMDVFTPVWAERVLKGPPLIPHMHMADIRSPAWRIKYGLSWYDSDRRVEEACRVIASTGSLHPVTSAMDGGHFRNVFKGAKLIKSGKQPGVVLLQPDHVAFMRFVKAALTVAYETNPSVEKVDFLVERKTGVTHELAPLLVSMDRTLRESGEEHLARLIGVFIPGDKTHVPVQAADVSMWHTRRVMAREADRDDIRRQKLMFDGRWLNFDFLDSDQISGIGDRNSPDGLKPAPWPFTPKVKRNVG